jgi:hypothetical protein
VFCLKDVWGLQELEPIFNTLILGFRFFRLNFSHHDLQSKLFTVWSYGEAYSCIYAQPYAPQGINKQPKCQYK